MTLEQVQAMSDEEIRVKVAEKCGWKSVPCTVGGQPGYVAKTPDGETLWRGDGSRDPMLAILRNCPDYCNDLNACHEFEKGLTDDEHKQFRIHLWTITTGGNNDGYENVSDALRRAFISATARQRCEAFLMVGGAQC